MTIIYTHVFYKNFYMQNQILFRYNKQISNDKTSKEQSHTKHFPDIKTWCIHGDTYKNI
jgi:hypothetical protein